MVGTVAGHPKLVALTGGFKVSFGLAHSLADAALQAVCGKAPDVPRSFQLQEHVNIAMAGIGKF